MNDYINNPGDCYTTFSPPPSPMGHYIIDEDVPIIWLRVRKPSLVHRLSCRFFFGWRWVDASPSQGPSHER